MRTDAQLAEMSDALAEMSLAIDVGYTEFSTADVAFHDAVARATQNTLIVVCSDVVRGVVLELIADKLANAADRHTLMLISLQHHTEVFRAVKAGDGASASRLARHALYDYYAEYLPEADRSMLSPLLDP
jgi:DNA-binding FadR family transcriptional regulator